MDEIGIAQQYYIATRSSPSDDRSRVLKYGKMFAVFDRYGDIEPLGLGEQGIFYQGTRYLSELAVYLWNARPLLLSSTIKADNFLFTADLANVDVSHGDEVAIHRGVLHLLRSKFLWQGSCYEQFKLSNFGLEKVDVPFRIAIGTDFADIFEVRGMRREQRGKRLPDVVDADTVEISYQGLDNITRRTRIHCDITPQRITSTELEFDFSLAPKESIVFHLTASCDAPSRDHSISYASAMSAASSEMKAAAASTCRIQSSNNRFNDWVRRSLSDVEMMTMGNPEADYPYAGVPWFSTVFGRDGIFTALQMLMVSPWIAKGVLKFLAATQSQEVNPEIEAEPGKILHEMRSGEMANLFEVPFGRYYGTVDATPLYVVLADAYYERTGDRELIETLWPNIQAALDWIDRYGDVDGDGFVEYARHGSKGLVQQGWKDSNDSIFHADGQIANPPIALCEVQGYVYAAKMAGARLAVLMNDAEKSQTLQEQAHDLRIKFEDAFWCPELSTYALALDGHKQPCRVRASNAGHCLYSGIASRDHAALVAQTLLSKDFFTGWGVRTLAQGESRYNPLSYHNGSVWPHDNGIVVSGLARYGFKQLAGQILLGLLDTSSQVDLHRLPELFCGLERRHGEGPTLYPVACSPQAWAAGAVFMVIEACLGITVDGVHRRVIFDHPCLPQGIPQLWIRGLAIGNSSVDFLFKRRGHTVGVQVLEKNDDIEVIVK